MTGLASTRGAARRYASDRHHNDIAMTLDLRQFHDSFFDESHEGIAAMEDCLLHLRPGMPDKEVVNAIFRVAHSIKGGAATYGFNHVASFAHVVESLLIELREQQTHFTAEILELLRKSAQTMRGMMLDLQSGQSTQSRAIADLRLQLERLLTKPSPPPTLRAQSGQKRLTRTIECNPGGTSIRIDTVKFDDLRHCIAELVAAQSLVRQAAESLEAPASVHIRDKLALLERKILRLQEDCDQLRQITLGTLFDRFQSMAQTLAQKLGKKIEFQISGGEVAIDRSMLEKIRNCLIQLLRNSIDHGIEDSATRAAAGKLETGVVQLKAWFTGSRIFIEVADDGGGFDRDRLLRKAIAAGIVDRDAVLTDQEAYDLIFAPGVSTTEVVSEISGRGVGMDIVRRNIELLGGGIEIFSTPGRGSRFVIDVPTMTMHCVAEKPK
jgi:two-component system chemotaxis sensor kinase CheA